MKEHYKGMLIKNGKRPIYYLGVNQKFKKDYESCFNVYEAGNLITSTRTIEEARQEIDKIKEEEQI
ncbi:MAG: hypothetical protein J6S67_15050 [Methanobrevibacter sp.]|nr:hypothetical protein [Methanobrevibacter sp.]